MPSRHRLTLVLAAATMVVLTGCSSPQSESATTPSVQETSAATAEVTPTPTLEVTSETPVSDIEAAVQTFVGALEELGIEHSEPVRAEVGGSGAKARFDMTVNGFAAGINVFSDAQTLDAWGELSDAYGGIFVSSGTAVLTLNSSEGIGNSAEIAPSIADVVGGEARGV